MIQILILKMLGGLRWLEQCWKFSDFCIIEKGLISEIWQICNILNFQNIL
jgi:hypothetical protein